MSGARLQHFGWFLARGFGPHGWGHPYLDWDWDWTRPDLYQQSARELEQAGFDFVLIEDAPSLGSPQTIDLRVRHAFGGPKHDPLLLAPYLFQATRALGVIPTVAPFLLPAKLPQVKAAYPNLKLFIREDLTPRLIAAPVARRSVSGVGSSSPRPTGGSPSPVGPACRHGSSAPACN